MEHSEFSIMTALRGGYQERKASRNCDAHGNFEVREFLSGEKAIGDIPSRCPKCGAAADAADREREKRDEDKRRIVASRIPLRFWNCSFDTFRYSEAAADGLAAAKSFAERWPEQRKTGESLVLIGPVGTGKTHLAVSILKAAIKRGDSCRYCTVSELLREVRATWKGQGERTESQIIEHFGSVPMLVLDEVGATYGTEAERVLLFDVINERYERMLPTIVCGNVTMEQLAAALDERSVDRLRENGGKAAILGGGSNRREHG